MRIAAHRSTITAQATAPEASTKSAGASFFEILAGASAQPSNGTAVTAANAAPQKDSDTANQNAQPQTSQDANAQAAAENDALQNIAVPVASKSAAAQPRAPQAPATSSGNGTSRIATREAKAQTANSAPAANVTALVTVLPVQIAQISTLPVPSPGSSVQSGNSSSAQNSTPVVATPETRVTAANNASTAPVPATSGNRNQSAKPAGQELKFAAAMFDPSFGGAAPSDQTKNSAPSQTADATSASLSQTDSSVSLPDQSNDTSSGQKAVKTSQPAQQIVISAPLPDQPSNPLSGQTANTASTSAPQTAAPAALPLSSINLPDLNTLPNANATNQPAANATQSSKANASLPKATSIANAASAANNSQATSTNTPASASSHAAQSNSQGSNAQGNSSGNGSGQHTQSQTAQNQSAPQAPASSASAAQQTQIVSTHGTQHDSFASHVSSDAPVDTTRASERSAQPEMNETLPSAGINTANVIQKMNETEMRVGMHSAEFGEISIRTSVSQQQMLTQISVDHGDLGKAISAHIPTLESKLGGELGIRATVQVSESGMSFSGERNSSSPQRDQRTLVQPAAIESMEPSIEAYSSHPHVAAIAGDSYRLDIRA